MTGLPPKSKNCLGVSVPPIRDPIPPAKIAAKIIYSTPFQILSDSEISLQDLPDPNPHLNKFV